MLLECIWECVEPLKVAFFLEYELFNYGFFFFFDLSISTKNTQPNYIK
jgi:hypothetical protein